MAFEAVLAVRDGPQRLESHSTRLGSHEDGRFEEVARLRIAQVSRAGCEMIRSDPWPEHAGAGRLFVSPDASDFMAMQADLAGRGAELTAGRWGYELGVVADPDGDRLWFPRPEGLGVQFRFEAVVIDWRGPSPFFFAPIPQDLAPELRQVARAVTYGWGMIPVEAAIGGVAFKTSPRTTPTCCRSRWRCAARPASPPATGSRSR